MSEKSTSASTLKRVASTENFASSPLPKKTESSFGITEGSDADQKFISEANMEFQRQILEGLQNNKDSFSFGDALTHVREGVEAIVKDSFTDCFRPHQSPAWNWNIFLFMTWFFGILLRYCFLFPLRFLFFVSGTTLFALLYGLLLLLPRSEFRTSLLRQMIGFFAMIWSVSLSAVIKVHGIPPVHRKNQIYVSNHTSVLDFVIIAQHGLFASVGQKHGGAMGFLQEKVLTPLSNIWFERFESRDRRLVAQRIKDHINDLSKPPLLIFPEGVCVNNEAIVMFKKGVFEIDNVEICPIAMKYNKLFSDPYWDSKNESFLRHVFRIMKSWCLVVDVWFLEPQSKGADESVLEFTDRVKKMIAERAQLKDVPWDGYYKYYQPSSSFLAEKQKVWAQKLAAKFGMEVVKQGKDEKKNKEKSE